MGAWLGLLMIKARQSGVVSYLEIQLRELNDYTLHIVSQSPVQCRSVFSIRVCIYV